MLPARLLRVDWSGPVIIARYLTARDEVWVREVLGELDGFVGRTVGELEAELPAKIDALAATTRAPSKAIWGIHQIVRRSWASRVQAPRPPREIRAAVFDAAALLRREEKDLAAFGPDLRTRAIDQAARDLGIPSDEVDRCLFADRVCARRIQASSMPLSPSEAIERYNLSLIQGLLVRSDHIRVLVSSHVRAVVRFAKLQRLICTYEPSDAGTRIHLSGPLALFRHTAKYGRALATFLPSALSTPGWKLDADVVLGDTRGVFRATAADPIARSHALPREVDSAVERKFMHDVRRLGTTWTLHREAAAIALPHGVFFPDFTLRCGSAEVFVEIVGYYTPEYLAAKVRALRLAGLKNLIVVVDEALACEEGALVAGAVLRYRRVVDARKVIEAAERLRSALTPAVGTEGKALSAGKEKTEAVHA